MTQRKLGDALVNPIGIGLMGIGLTEGCYGPAGTDEERFLVLDEALASGCTHWDSADAYGDSEDLIGKWFKRTGKRDQIFLATKCGIAGASEDGIRGDAEYIKQQCNNSLKRLGVDYIDLFYQHRVDRKTPIEVTIRAMADLVKEGKIKYIGLSECGANDLRRAHAVHPITALQIEYSPLVLHLEDPKLKLLETARELGVKIVAYSPLARGLITGTVKSHADLAPDDYRRVVPKYSNENFPKILSVVEKIGEIGKKHNANPGQVTLAWVLAQGDDFFIIPGTKKVKYLKENMAAGSVKLSAEEIAAIRKIAEETEIPGSRFDPFNESWSSSESPPLPK